MKKKILLTIIISLFLCLTLSACSNSCSICGKPFAKNGCIISATTAKDAAQKVCTSIDNLPWYEKKSDILDKKDKYLFLIQQIEKHPLAELHICDDCQKYYKELFEADSVSGSIVSSKNDLDDYSQIVSTGKENALKSACSYLESSAFSYNGLIKQLEFEGYTNDEAKYGADNCGASWREQALKSAKSYLKYSSFSYEGLMKQLEFEGFSNEEAQYGADNCGADWMEQAVKCAKSYLEYSSFSKQGLIDQLEFEGFTHTQAVYGVEQNGY